MRNDQVQLFFRSAIAILIATFLTTTAAAQMFGMPAPAGNTAWDDVMQLAPEDEPAFCLIWNKAGELDLEGNESDKWLSNPELQKSLGKLKKAIITVAAEQGPPLLGRFGKDVGWKFLAKAGMFTFENIDAANETGNGNLIVRLGEDEELISAFLDDLMDEADLESESVGKDEVYLLPETPFPVAIGIHDGYLVAAFGHGQWKTVTDRIDEKPAAPEWLTTRMKTVSVTRRGQFMFGSTQVLMDMLPPEAGEDPQFKQIRETLDLDGLKSVSFCAGADSTSNVAIVHFECDRKKGLASIMNVPKIERAKLDEIPADSISATAVRFSPKTAMEFVRTLVPPEIFDGAMANMAEEIGLDLERDIIDHLEGTVRHYMSGIVINPKQVAVVRINDELSFKESYDKINAKAKELAERQGLTFYEKEKNGLTVYGVKNYGVSGYWAVHKGDLYISTNSRAIGSHIRKAVSGSESSVMTTELAKKILSDSATRGLDGPIMMQHNDLDQITETVAPLLQGAMAFLPPEVAVNFDFNASDFPPIESLLGLRPTNSMVFKSENGYTGISRYDTPVPFELSTVAFSGVAVGMMLPAVQATREAARRTQSMNNQRQVALALLNYESANGEFPPAYTVDADGNPLLSWRVAILPYLEEQDLYDSFNHDEPWDSEHNIKLLERMPLTLKNPSTGGEPGWTDYVTPLSDDSILTPGVGAGFADITDGSSNTIMVMEVGQSQQVPWTSPRDIEIDTLESLDLDNGHPGTVLVTMADGSTHAISKLTEAEKFIGATKKSDGVGLGDQ